MHHRLAAAGLFALGLIFALTAPRAHEYRVGAIRIDHPWARATAGAAPVGAGFLVLVNEGQEDDRLVGARAAAADRVDIHRHLVQDGVMRMRLVALGVPVPAGETVAFAPGAYHLMLIGLKRPLVEGQRLPVTLHFARAGAITVELAVEGIAAMGDHDHGG